MRMRLGTVQKDGPPNLSSHVLRSQRFESIPWLKHGITSRIAGLETAEGNVGYSPPRDRTVAWRNRQAWCDAVAVNPYHLVTVRQVHGNGVLIANPLHGRNGAEPGKMATGDADALVTDAPGLPLMTLHADCQPILFVDHVRRAVGVAHAGWRGVVTNVAGATVQAMRSAFGSVPSDIHAYLGPAIGVECYEVGQEVIAAWEDAVGLQRARYAVSLSGRYPRFDLSRANRLLLVRAGIPAQNIDEAGICTACSGETWFSHRGQGPTTGRFAVIIALDEDSR
jgi:YfiH family protein